MSDREEKPEMPDDPRKSLPSPTRACPECGDESSMVDRPSESEKIGGYTRRIDYWCPDCDTHVGTRTSYEGPEPVRTYNGWEIH